jgi:hypothetical protein
MINNNNHDNNNNNTEREDWLSDELEMFAQAL